MKFIHITDLHLTPPGELLWGNDVHAKTVQCLDDIIRWQSDAEFCIISGDLSERGDEAAYRWLAEQLARLPMPVHLMIGNHDHRQTFLECFPRAPRDAAGFIQSAFDTAAGRFILLDTVKTSPTSSAGEFCQQRQAWLGSELEAAAGRPVWLFMHHPPFDVGIAYMDRIKLEDHSTFARMTHGHGGVKHIFFGHVHRALYVTWLGIPCTALPALCHQIPIDRQTVTGGKPYIQGPAMYGIVTIENGQTTVHFEQFEYRDPAVMP